MRLSLISDDLELSLEIPLSDLVEEALTIQWRRIEDQQSSKEAFRRRLTTLFESAAVQSLDWDLKPPTRVQVTYGMDIARTLGIAIPSEALRYRGTMHDFIEHHSDIFKARVTAKKVR